MSGPVLNPPTGVPRVRDYVTVLIKNWLVVVAAVVLSAAAVVVGNRYLDEPEYVAATQLFAVVPGDAQTRSAYEGNRGAFVRMDTYAQLATSSMVTQRVVDELGLLDTPAELAKRITTTTVPDTRSQFSYPMSVLLNVKVGGSDARTVVEEANAVGQNLAAASRELESSGNEPGPELIVVDEANLATRARSSWLVDAGTGAGLGLVLSCLAVLATGVRRDKVLNRDHVAYLARESTVGQRTGNS